MEKRFKQKFVYINRDFHGIKQYEVGMVERVVGDIAHVKFMGKDEHVPVSYLVEFDIDKTGDAYSRKICNRCFRLLPTAEMFQKNQNGKGDRTIRRPSCNDCREEIDGKPVSSRDRKEWEKIKPNLVIWECPICHKKSIPGLNSKVVLDHDHKTGKPRAWICDSCNTGLGRFNDNVEILRKVTEYLEYYDRLQKKKKR